MTSPLLFFRRIARGILRSSRTACSVSFPRLNTAAVAATSALLSIAAVAEAVPTNPITWGTAQTISGDADVSTAGTLVYAYNFGTTAVTGATVGGVTFAAFGIVTNPGTTTATVGNLQLVESPGVLAAYSNLGGSGAPYTSLSSGYQTLLGSGGSADNPFTISVGLGGLTAGRQYSVQWWSSNSSGLPGNFGFSLGSTTAEDSFSNQVTLSSTASGLGQYVIGTFTATGTTQYFDLDAPGGQNAPLINALQLRDVTATAVPGSAGLVSTISAVFGLTRRRRR